MALDPKDLKKLAAACRAAGIKHYKADGVEFTLSDEAPESPYKKRKAKKSPQKDPEPGAPIDSDGWDSLTEDQKLFYSVTDSPFEKEEEAQA